MRRKTFILALLYLSWIIINVHRLWNNTEPVERFWFPLDPTYKCSWHWYIHTILKDLSYCSVFLAFYLYITSSLKRDKDIKRLFLVLLLIHVSDIVHYVLAARHSEAILGLQGLSLILVTGYNLYRKIDP